MAIIQQQQQQKHNITTNTTKTNITIIIASLQIIKRKIKLSYRIFSSLYNEKNIKKYRVERLHNFKQPVLITVTKIQVFD